MDIIPMSSATLISTVLNLHLENVGGHTVLEIYTDWLHLKIKAFPVLKQGAENLQ